MVEFWSLVGYLAVSVAAGIVTAAITLVLGGLGGLRGLANRLSTAEDEIDRANKRITVEQKTRAAQAGVAARQKVTDAELTAAATQTLAENLGPQRGPMAGGRPSVVGRR